MLEQRRRQREIHQRESGGERQEAAEAERILGRQRGCKVEKHIETMKAKKVGLVYQCGKAGFCFTNCSGKEIDFPVAFLISTKSFCGFIAQS